MKTNYLQELAVHTVSHEKVDAQVSQFVLTKLSKSQLREYTRYLKRELAKRTLVVSSATPLSDTVQKALLSHFDKKYLDNRIDTVVGAGIVISNNDDIIDLSLMGEIRRFIRTIA